MEEAKPTEKSKSVVLLLECKAPSLNQINGARYQAFRGPNRMSRGWAKHQLGKNRWREYLSEACHDEMADGFRIVTFTRLMGHGERPYDDDNLIGGLKSLRDYLVDCGFIIGDGPNAARFHYGQRKSKDGDPYIKIVIERP